MKINIFHCIDGAKQARGAAVIIDVFRAFTVECYLSQNGAAEILPVGSLDFVREYKKAHPDTVLVGERHGVKLPGFDFGNSPSAVKPVDFRGKTVMHTTSAGTQGIANACGADIVLTGALVNAKAIANYIKSRGFSEVSLVCMGLEGTTPTAEDDLCAEYIKSILEERPISLAEPIEDLKRTSGAKFFDPGQASVFPTEDFYLSTDFDRFNFVLQAEKCGELTKIRRINL